MSFMPPDIPPSSLLVTRWLQFRRTRAFGATRHELMRRYAELIAALCEHDLAAIVWAETRVGIIKELAAIENILWPPLDPYRARRAPSPDSLRVPDPAPGAITTSGVHLRRICREILHRHGPQSLVELHRLLHLYGYVIAARAQAKALADALAYEVERKRARRVKRGVYEAIGPAPSGVELGHPWLNQPQAGQPEPEITATVA
jgi:hypothetical protein